MASDVRATGRRSKCAEESRQAQLERIRAMTPLERIAMALALGRRRQYLLRRRDERLG